MSLIGNLTANLGGSQHMIGAVPYPDRSGSICSYVHGEDSHGGIVVEDREADEQEVRRLARHYSRASTSDGAPHLFDAAGTDSEIDPNSESFSARAWTKSLLRLQKQSGQANIGRTAGFAFRNLSAFGYSKGSDFQKTVNNYPLAAADVVRSLTGNKGRRVDILRNCEGVVLPGEMLVVLGPPGSGCSTFLKTIAGETHGFSLSNESSINYQGRPSYPAS
jgi:ATP-binding cassette subfamily G (WHITE) protein 2 (PDR)